MNWGWLLNVDGGACPGVSDWRGREVVIELPRRVVVVEEQGRR